MLILINIITFNGSVVYIKTLIEFSCTLPNFKGVSRTANVFSRYFEHIHVCNKTECEFNVYSPASIGSRFGEPNPIPSKQAADIQPIYNRPTAVPQAVVIPTTYRPGVKGRANNPYRPVNQYKN